MTLIMIIACLAVLFTAALIIKWIIDYDNSNNDGWS